MSKAVFQTVIQDAHGDILSGASIEIRLEASGALATTYEDRDGNGNPGNPFNTDTTGFARVYVDEGVYRVTVTAAGYSREYRHVVLLEDATLGAGAGGEITTVLPAGETVDLEPVGFDASVSGTAVLYFETGSGDASLASLEPGANGQELLVMNKGPNLLTLNAEDASGTAAQRFYAAFDLSLLAKTACKIRYSLSLARWMVLP